MSSGTCGTAGSGEAMATRRVIVILHPTFDLEGDAGVRAAKEYADQLVKGMNLSATQQLAQNPNSDGAAKLKAYLAGFRHLVRNIEESDL